MKNKILQSLLFVFTITFVQVGEVSSSDNDFYKGKKKNDSKNNQRNSDDSDDLTVGEETLGNPIYQQEMAAEHTQAEQTQQNLTQKAQEAEEVKKLQIEKRREERSEAKESAKQEEPSHVSTGAEKPGEPEVSSEYKETKEGENSPDREKQHDSVASHEVKNSSEHKVFEGHSREE